MNIRRFLKSNAPDPSQRAKELVDAMERLRLQREAIKRLHEKLPMPCLVVGARHYGSVPKNLPPMDEGFRITPIRSAKAQENASPIQRYL